MSKTEKGPKILPYLAITSRTWRVMRLVAWTSSRWLPWIYIPPVLTGMVAGAEYWEKMENWRYNKYTLTGHEQNPMAGPGATEGHTDVETIIIFPYLAHQAAYRLSDYFQYCSLSNGSSTFCSGLPQTKCLSTCERLFSLNTIKYWRRYTGRTDETGNSAWLGDWGNLNVAMKWKVSDATSHHLFAACD